MKNEIIFKTADNNCKNFIALSIKIINKENPSQKEIDKLNELCCNVNDSIISYNKVLLDSIEEKDSKFVLTVYNMEKHTLELHYIIAFLYQKYENTMGNKLLELNKNILILTSYISVIYTIRNAYNIFEDDEK